MRSDESTSPPPLSAAQTLKIWRADAADGGGRTGVSLAQLLERYLTAHPDLSDETVEQYTIALDLAAEFAATLDEERERDWANDPLTCDEIFELDRFEAFTAWLLKAPRKNGKRRAVRTVRGRRATALMFWRFSHRRKLCSNPAPDHRDLAKLKCPKEDPVAWFPWEVRAVIQSAMKARPILWWTPSHWVSILCCMWYSTERFQALLECRLADLEGNVLHVRGCRTKDKKPGVHPLPTWLTEMIRGLPELAGDAVPENLRDRLWPFPFSRKSMRNHYRSDVLKVANLPCDSKHLFHCIRRSGLTEMVNQAGMEAAQKLARHSSPGLTLECYISKAKLRGETSASVLPSPLPRAEQLNLF